QVVPVCPVPPPLVHVPHHVEAAPARLAARPGARVHGAAGDRDVAVRRPIVRPRVGRARRRALPLPVRQQSLPRQQARLVRLEPADARGRKHPGDRHGVDARRRRVRPENGGPVAVGREVGGGDPAGAPRLSASRPARRLWAAPPPPRRPPFSIFFCPAAGPPPPAPAGGWRGWSPPPQGGGGAPWGPPATTGTAAARQTAAQPTTMYLR